jgi:D-alanine-D-alanine ligase
MKILLMHTAPPATMHSARQTFECDLSAAAKEIADVIPHAAIACVKGELREIMDLLDAHDPDVVYNLCEAPLGRPDLEPHVASLLEWAGVRFTGCGSETLALCRRKDRTAGVLAAAGVQVPTLRGFPCIVKPADEDGSAFIDRESICEDEAAIARARARVPGPIVIEEFLPGREFAVSLWGRVEPEHLSVGETKYKNGLRLNTYQSKWETESSDYADSPLSYDLDIDPNLYDEVIDAARGAWRAVGARGYLRVDVRLNSGGAPRVLDVNPNPETGPEVGIYRAVLEAGWTWKQFVEAQLAWAR